MNVIGIICEYNPFHNGHIYHINKIKEMYPDSIIILVLNGYFLERGDISIISKNDKVSIALNNNIDLVVELPFVFGSQAADIFGYNAIKLLEELKCEYVIFGSESNNIDLLIKLSEYQLNNKNYNEDVKKYLKDGINYPTALAKALNTDFEFKANDLLGISYIKAIKNNNYNIKPILIKRTNEYLDTLDNSDIISATNIRKKINDNIDISKYVPKITLKYINNVDYQKVFELLRYKILTDIDLSIYLDVDEGIENKLKKEIICSNSYDDFIEKIKSKRYTYNKIKRMLIHILIGLTKKDNLKMNLEYIRVLGFNKIGKNYLNKIKKDLKLPIIPNKESSIYDYELKVALIYDLITNNNDNYAFEISNKPIYFK